MCLQSRHGQRLPHITLPLSPLMSSITVKITPKPLLTVLCVMSGALELTTLGLRQRKHFIYKVDFNFTGWSFGCFYSRFQLNYCYNKGYSYVTQKCVLCILCSNIHQITCICLLVCLLVHLFVKVGFTSEHFFCQTRVGTYCSLEMYM